MYCEHCGGVILVWERVQPLYTYQMTIQGDAFGTFQNVGVAQTGVVHLRCFGQMLREETDGGD